MENSGTCIDCGGLVKTAGRERCVGCARRYRAAVEIAARPLCARCGEVRVSRKSASVCSACWLAARGSGATPEAEAERVRKIVASGVGTYERTPEIRAKMAAAKLGRPVLATRRESHWNWKGGRKGDGNGYVVVLVDGEYRKEHRVVMELHLGRSLIPGEEVHHINGKRDDNRLENLMVVTRAEHRVLEGRLLRAAYDAMQANIISFHDGEYRLAESPHCPTCTCQVTQD